MKIVVFGAGNIGRSFVGQLFARAGYEVVFVDVDSELVTALNREGRYRIEIRDRHPETIVVERVSALHGEDGDRVATELARADIAATAVGPQALPHIYPALAAGLVQRRRAGAPPLDLIICENLRNAAHAFRLGLAAQLPADFPLEESVGLIETSIGKMVPIMLEEARRRDPLLLYAEAYNTLILDAKAFRNAIPQVPGLDPKENMPAYVDRKAFMHNCGHAACAYLGYLSLPGASCTWECVADEDVREAARRAMWESGRALIRKYPGEFTEENQREHIEDLLTRFGNKALGDTIYRVGRDLFRKLSRDDRLVGALLLDWERDVPAPATTLAAASGLLFRATDEHGDLFAADARFATEFAARGLEWVLEGVCGLDEGCASDAGVARGLRAASAYLKKTPFAWLRRFLDNPEASFRAE